MINLNIQEMENILHPCQIILNYYVINLNIPNYLIIIIKFFILNY